MFGTQPQYSKHSDFRPELFINTVIHCGKKLGYALPMRTDYEETINLKRHNMKGCPSHANKDMILKRIIELKCFKKKLFFFMKSETDDGLSSCSNFTEHPSSYELESKKQVFSEIEHLKRE